MDSEIVFLQFINVQNCFLHLSKDIYAKLVSPSVCGLRLVTTEGRELYFSTQPVPHQGLSDGLIGISHKYAKLLELREKEGVIVKPIYNIGSIQTVNVTPVSEDDFEITQSSSLEVERSLLNQLRIIQPKQTFPVWVSKNVIVNLVIDSIVPNLKYGRLEEYSEVVVNNVIKKNGFEKVSSSTVDENAAVQRPLKEKLSHTNILKFRCIPLDEAPKQDNIFSTHPFVVFTSHKSIPEWALTRVTSNKKTVWKLKKDTDELMRCVVCLFIIELNEFEKDDDCNFKNLYLSKTIKNHLGLELGSKITLDLIDADTVDITGLLISPHFSFKDEEKVIGDVRNAFIQAVEHHGDLLLNTKTAFPLKEGNVMITLRPLHAEWSFIDINKINELDINFNEYCLFSKQNTQVNNGFKVENYMSMKYEELIEKGKLAVELSLALHTVKNYRFYDNVIYVGKSGCGKTTLVNCLLDKLQEPPFYMYTKRINCCILKGKRVETLGKYFSDILNNCIAHEPSVLFLDDLDLLSISLEDVSEQAFHLTRVTNKLAEMIDNYQSKHFLIVFATAKSLDDINPKLFSKKGKSLFTSVLAVPDLPENNRAELLKNMTTKISAFQLSHDMDLSNIVSSCDGYSVLDLKRLTEKAVFEAWQRKAKYGGKISIKIEDFQNALKNFKPSSLQNVNFHKGPNKSWLNVGGLEDVKVKLKEVICWSTMYPEIMKQCPVKPQTGILLYGAPGTGKTLIASALAGESKMNFISIKGPELMSKYIGESEEGIRKLFEKAQAARPCLLFFDEFDSLAPRRGQDQTGVTDRVVNQMLTALDGIDSLSGVWVVAATSRPDLIDPAILRPGRIGISVLCPVPDKDARLSILKVLCEKISLSDDVNLEEIALLTEGFTGADLRGVLTSAQIKTLDSLQNNGPILTEENISEKDLKSIELSRECLMLTLKEMEPTLTPNEKRRYESIYEKFEKRIPMDPSQQKVTHA